MTVDKERIEKAAKVYALSFKGMIYYEEYIVPFLFKAFSLGSNIEHPIAFNQGKMEGFNEGIEAARKVAWQYSYSSTILIAELDEAFEKLKKPI